MTRFQYYPISGSLVSDSVFPSGRAEAPERPPRCPCRDPRCRARRLWWRALAVRPDVRAGAPSDWWGCLALGYDPVTGTLLPDDVDGDVG